MDEPIDYVAWLRKLIVEAFVDGDDFVSLSTLTAENIANELEAKSRALEEIG